MSSPQWFRIASGENEGKLRISGWFLSAVKGEQLLPGANSWLRFGCCPVCEAMVMSGGMLVSSDRTWDHERWHAQTDFPVPARLLTDEDRAAGYA